MEREADRFRIWKYGVELGTFTIEEAAQILGISTGTFYGYMSGRGHFRKGIRVEPVEGNGTQAKNRKHVDRRMMELLKEWDDVRMMFLNRDFTQAGG